jgi:hypothetical protein
VTIQWKPAGQHPYGDCLAGESEHGWALINVHRQSARLTILGRCTFGSDGQPEPGLYIAGKTTINPDSIEDGRTTFFLKSDNVIETAKRMAESRIG